MPPTTNLDLTSYTTTTTYPPSLTLALTNHFTPSQLSTLLATHIPRPPPTTTTTSPAFTSPQANTTSNLPLFVYGSLMLPSQLLSVISSYSGEDDDDEEEEEGGEEQGERALARKMTPAVLVGGGYERRAVRWAGFPAVVAEGEGKGGAGKRVEGLLIFGLSSAQKARIDAYEGGLYVKEKVDVDIGVRGGDDGEDRDDRDGENEGEGESKDGTEENSKPCSTPAPATNTNTKTTTKKLTLKAEIYIWAGSKSELYEVAEKVWSIEGFLESRFWG